jgi:hypothetical protein
MRTYGGDQFTDEPRTTPAQPMLYDLVFSADGRRLAASRNNKTIAVWDIVTGDRICTFVVEHTPHRIAFTPDSNRLRLYCRTKVIEDCPDRSNPSWY